VNGAGTCLRAVMPETPEPVAPPAASCASCASCAATNFAILADHRAAGQAWRRQGQDRFGPAAARRNRGAKHLGDRRKGGFVILEGTIDNWDERQAVVSAAWSAPGVRSVEDQLRIVP